MLEKVFNNISFIKNYGFNFLDLLFILVVIILFIEIYNIIKRIKLNKKIESLPSFQLNQNILNQLEEHRRKLEYFAHLNKNFDFDIKKLKDEIKNQYQIEIIKYNPYQDMGVGGKQSFSIAFLNKLGNGFIVSSLYSREKNRVLIKEIKNKIVSQELSNEEKEIFEIVKNRI